MRWNMENRFRQCGRVSLVRLVTGAVPVHCEKKGRCRPRVGGVSNSADFESPAIESWNTIAAIWGRMGLLGSGAVVHHPIHVRIVFGTHVKREGYPLFQDGIGAGIQPTFDFGVTVRKGKTAGAIMIAGRKIDDLPFGAIGRPTGHADHKFTVVNAVFPFIKKDPGARGSRIPHVTG